MNLINRASVNICLRHPPWSPKPCDFAERIQEGLAAADNNFKHRRELINMSEVQVRLTIENTKKVAYVQCPFGEKRLLIMSLATYEKFWYNGLKLIPLFILVNFCTRDSDIGLSFGRYVEHSGWLTWRLAFQV